MACQKKVAIDINKFLRFVFKSESFLQIFFFFFLLQKILFKNVFLLFNIPTQFHGCLWPTVYYGWSQSNRCHHHHHNRSLCYKHIHT